MNPLVFLDFDDVICLNKSYGGYDVVDPNPSEAVWKKLFHPPAVELLRVITEEFDPRFVITTSWLRLLDRDGFDRVFQKTALDCVGQRLHQAWQAPQDRGMTRHAAIKRWLAMHHCGEPFVVLDDEWSGSGLPGSRMHKHGRVVLCQIGVGLHAGHLDAVRVALRH